MNSNLKKQFILENIEKTSTIRKIEFDLTNNFHGGSFRINKENHILYIDFKNGDNVGKDTKTIIDTIHAVSGDIDVIEREVKPVYRKVLILEDLDCANCAAKIERIAKRTFDHEFIVVDFATARFIIETSDKELIDTLQARVQKIVESVDTGIRVIQRTSGDNAAKTNSENTRNRIFLLIGSLIFAIGFFVSHFLSASFFTPASMKTLFVYIAYGVGYLFVGGDVLFGALSNIRSGRIFDEKFLMSLATVVALGIGYLDEAVFVMLFYKLGELLQQHAVNYSRKSIAALMDIRPETANILVNGEYVEIDPIEAVVGDIIQIRPGERVPLDGIIEEGESSLDISALTGESILKDVKRSDEILSGSINVSGTLEIKVTKAYQDSMVAKILDMVENASSLKTKSENFISKFAKYYTPTVVFTSIVLAVLLPFVYPGYQLSWENGFKESIMTALIFLVVSCPCALVISIPLGYFGGIGGASRQGILIKGSNYLEALNSVDTIVFDKTGTLTEGKFQVDKILSFGNYNNQMILEYAAHAEYGSSHLIAKSIVEAYGNENIISSRIKNKKQNTNTGISAVVDGMDLYVGKKEYLLENGIEVKDLTETGSIIYVAVDLRCEGCIIIRDRIKPNAKAAISELKRLGIQKTAMLTGDGPMISKDVAVKLGIDEYYAEMSPISKVTKFTEIKSKISENSKIAFVGDGINDAPVLSRADVGIAMGALGSDAAIEVADIVLMTDDIGKLAIAKKIARKTKNIIIQNVTLALMIKFLVLILAMLKPLEGSMFFARLFDFLIYFALFADVGVSLIAVVNSLRAMRIKL